ncbi:Pbp1p NDAI_0D01970 [Naumovozyma dairenensis CBS 421]|uniref:LsmAD domain-containing protein n=1 Tax=Naumovozyma dairenensis (strain ATCC 10597 / BCRC 20456 / CBS 421 / NBRC 0211 / NRRL Y-12639) TaxID=1071378 RepID=G0W9Q0_NAUDC|nr:hypothetical protein NDAI_0D01970 [Naumovozyma dairenensis CBS 421]CCD24511.1 hypothetical protein NDAI_0D01970 [Naumovozyma dairenensis CBS 421]
MKGNFNNKKSEPGGKSTGFFENGETTKNFNNRFDYLMTNSVGSNVFVTVSSGITYEGLLVSCNLESQDGVDVVLKFPKVVNSSSKVDGDIEKLSNALGSTLIINGSDVAELELKDIDLSLEEKSEHSQTPSTDGNKAKTTSPTASVLAAGSGEFKTDVDISSRKEFKQRELERWTPDEGSAHFAHNAQTLEEASSTWDQFAVNEAKFGVTNTFDEHFYTTKINKNDPQYRQRLKEAERIAKEIESQGAQGNIHLAEDRGIIIDDSGMDEEDLYSGVDRRGDELLASLKSNAKPITSKVNKYVPPTLRNQPHHMDPAIISSTTSTSKQMGNTSNDVKETVVLPPTNQEKVAKKEKSKHREGSKSKISSKEAQIEELKKFSEKFKVPYDVPTDMKDIFKKQASVTTPSGLKTDPSLPPKPSMSTKANTPPVSKSDSKRNVGSSTHENQSGAKGATHSRKRTPGSFFGSKKPTVSSAIKKDLFRRSFNMFIKAKENYDEKMKEKEEQESTVDTTKKTKEDKVMEPFFIEKPYFTAPTWPNTIEKSYKDLFPDQKTLMQKAQVKMQQRAQMNQMPMASNMNPHLGVGMGAGMMRFQMGGPAPTSPMMNAAGFPGMYMPFQPQPPMFYPPMGAPMMLPTGDMEGAELNGPPSQPVSPRIPPAYMAAAGGAPQTSPMGAFGYPGAAMPFQPMMGASNGVVGGGMPRQYNQHGGNGGHHGRHNNYNSHGGNHHHNPHHNNNRTNNNN